MFNIFIERPILSIVISLIITLLGGLAVISLPVTQFPDIAPPAVTVTTKYTGANAEVCAKAVVTPLERAINGVSGMTYMTSVSGNDGASIIQVYFEVGTNPDIASVNVQNRVTAVLDEMPEEVIKAGVIVEKEVNSMLMYLNLLSTDSTVDEKFIYNFADINVLAELKRINGVGFADIMGSREYAMRVWLMPDRMTVYNISAEDVIAALRSQNVEAAPGKIGESSGKEAQSLQYVLRYTGKFTSKEQYENIILKADENGQMLRLKDIATIEFGSLDYDVLSKENGKPSAAILLKQRPGSNASEVIANVKKRMEELKASTFPSNIDYTISYDVSRFLDASIHEVIKTLIEAFILVALVVFIFLQDFRSTIIPILAVPVSLVGTFFFMQLFGFSINLLTLFALVLAIGIVVDDAIVVVEAVHAKMETDHLTAREATFAAMGEISGAIIAITLVMSAVFIPAAFMSGPVGVFYRQFSITMAISIVISGVNALTLTPALCAMMLTDTHGKEKKKTWLNQFFFQFNTKYDQLSNLYKKLIELIANRRVVTFMMLAFFIFATYGTNLMLPSGFIPTEDQGTIYANVTTPSGATLERTEDVMDYIEQATKSIAAVESSSTLAGFSLMTDGAGASFGMGMISLKPWENREESVDDIIDLLTEKTKNIKDASIQFFPPPAVPGYGNASGFELRIQDRTGSGDLKKLEKITTNFIEALNKQPEINNVFTSFNASFPQYLVKIDNDKAAQKGVSTEKAMDNLQTIIGSFYTTNFIRFGQMYKVMVQALPKYRRQPEDILKLYVKNNMGEMVPYSAFASVERVNGVEQLTRYNMYTSAMVNGEAAAGYSSGSAIEAVKRVAKEKLPKGYTYDWSGMTRDEVLSGNQIIYIFIISLLFVYLLLAAQYESFLLPLPVVLSLPTGVFGSYFLLILMGLQNNIYAQVALVMLIGLLGKNAILIVEFAILKQKEGLTPLQAAIDGAVARLRPLLMTSLAFVAGLIPLMLASGAGAIGNQTIGTAAAGGMLFGTAFGLIIVPGLYVIFATMAEKTKRNTTSLPSKTFIMLLFVGVLFTNCKPTENLPKTSFRAIPESFDGKKDTTNFANINWKNYFMDSTLHSLIDTALQNNFDLSIALQRIEMSRSQIKFASGLTLPFVAGTTSAGQRRFGKYTMDGIGNFDTNFSNNITESQKIPEHLPDYYIGLQSAWEIDIWGKLKNIKKAALARYLASVEGKNFLITNLIAQVANFYYELLALDNELETIQKTIVLQEDAFGIIKIQKQGGMANELAVQQFEAQLLNFKSLEFEIKQQIINAENRLNFLLGRFPQPIQRNKLSFGQPIPAQLYTGIPTQLLTNRPDIRQAAMEVMATKADLYAAQTAFYPSLNITANLGFQTFNPQFILSPTSLAYNLLGNLTAPLVNRSAIKARFGIAKASQIEALYNYQKSIVNAYTEVYNQLNNIKNLGQVYSLKSREVETLTNAITTSSTLFSTGRATYLEVIITQSNALQARLSLAIVKQRQFSAMIDIYRALGGGRF